MADKNLISVGLYRHFKGGYYYVTSVSKYYKDNEIVVCYFDVCHPEHGSFVRSLDDFVAESDLDSDGISHKYIRDKFDNVTGQIRRFERVKDLNFQLGSVSTEQLISELRNRSDSPIHELDIEGLHSNVFSKDYIVGEAYLETDSPVGKKGVYTINVFDSKEQAYEFLSKNAHKKNTRVFKRTFIKI